MPKMKSSRTLAKRIKVTASGKIKVHHAYKGHLAPNKTRKEKKHLAKAYYVDHTDVKRIKQMIDYKAK
jgi:large subunit ribosomal protein L35